MTQSVIPTWDNGVTRLYHADARRIPLPDESVHCVVTSPPYWSLRDYGLEPSVWGGDPDCLHYWGDGVAPPVARSGDGKSGPKQLSANRRDRMPRSAFCGECGAWKGTLGLEPTVGLYLEHTVQIFREVWRVLRKDGTCWINMGDSYADKRLGADIKPKDLVGVPWRVALALQADGWWVRSPVIWDKPNPMPESAIDRPTMSHEYVFMLARSGRPLYWTHRDGAGSRVKPAPDYRYLHQDTGREVAATPDGWRVDGSGWRRVNLWGGHDYYFDPIPLRKPLAESSIARISQPSFWRQEGGVKVYGNGVNPNRSARTSLENPAQRTPSGWNVNHDQPSLLGRYPQKRERQRGHRRPHRGFIDKWDQMTLAEQRAAGANGRTVWTIAATPYPGDHYATFPEELPRRCILAGTSEYGVCAECGAPWERVVKKSAEGPVRERRNSGLGTNYKETFGLDQPTSEFQESVAYATTGWQPTCACDAAVVPATVLDPFVGSGTTAAVAQRLGRRSVGVDASAKYLELAVKRVGAVSLPLLPRGGSWSA